MRLKRIFLTLTVILGLSITLLGCEYDPSLYQKTASDNGLTTGVVLENTIIRSGPGEEYEEVEYLSVGEVVIITGDIEDGYYPVNYDDYAFGYVAETCLEIHEPVTPGDESQADNVITAITIDDVNIRRGPGQNYELIENVGPGTVLTIIGEQENGYYPVDYNGEIGYAHHNFIEINESSVSADPGADTVLIATVIDDINIRRGPGQNYELIESLGPGAVLTIIGEEENGYYPVDYNGEVGYAHHNFIEITEQPVAVQTETIVDAPITVDNNEAFAEVLSITNENDERIAQFFRSHIGDEIEFDGYIAYLDNHGSWSSRYDVLVNVGDNDYVGGPLFHFTDVSFVYDMHFDENTPDMVGMYDEFRFTAVIVSFDEQTRLIELDPISTVYRGS